ncbi:unnamed protein product [Soboliphyme baturini]|uniref:Myosin motor domain-containing protein n=1 Tax=Soboliphyme baturini TaxID=241478 RepID=A0A183IRE5_9BILA|nr:unnamed protein product [Soboliphyme baturini]
MGNIMFDRYDEVQLAVQEKKAAFKKWLGKRAFYSRAICRGTKGGSQSSAVRPPIAKRDSIKEKAVEQMEMFKFLGIVFTSDGKFEEEIDRRIGVACGVLHELGGFTVTKAELSLKTKLSVFTSIFIPMVTCGHEWWTMN